MKGRRDFGIEQFNRAGELALDPFDKLSAFFAICAS